MKYILLIVVAITGSNGEKTYTIQQGGEFNSLATCRFAASIIDKDARDANGFGTANPEDKVRAHCFEK